jgi:hypothetical protein
MKFLINFLAILFLFNAYGSEKQNNNLEKSREEGKAKSEIDIFSKEDPGLLSALKEKWTRIAFSQGLAEFKINNVKFVAGDGIAETSSFKKFRLFGDCPFYTESQNLIVPDFISYENPRKSNSIKLKGNTTSIAFSKTSPFVDSIKINGADKINSP